LPQSPDFLTFHTFLRGSPTTIFFSNLDASPHTFFPPTAFSLPSSPFEVKVSTVFLPPLLSFRDALLIIFTLWEDVICRVSFSCSKLNGLFSGLASFSRLAFFLPDCFRFFLVAPQTSIAFLPLSSFSQSSPSARPPSRVSCLGFRYNQPDPLILLF